MMASDFIGYLSQDEGYVQQARIMKHSNNLADDRKGLRWNVKPVVKGFNEPTSHVFSRLGVQVVERFRYRLKILVL